MATITKDEGRLVPAERLDDLEWCLRYLTELGCGDCDPDAPGCVTCLARRLHRELFPEGPIPDDTRMPDMTPAEALVLLAGEVAEGVPDPAHMTYAEAQRLQALKTIQDLVPAAPRA